MGRQVEVFQFTRWRPTENIEVIKADIIERNHAEILHITITKKIYIFS